MNADPKCRRLPGVTGDVGSTSSDAWPVTPELIAIDLDGTLLDPSGQVSVRTREAVQAVLTRGIRVAIATGRTWWESRAVIEAAGLTGPGVFAGGSVVNDLFDGRTLAKTTIDPASASAICAIVEDAGYPAMVFRDTNGSGAEFAVSDGIAVPPSLADWWRYHRSDITLQADLATPCGHPGTLRITTAATPEAITLVGSQLRKQLSDRCYWHTIRVPAYGVEVLEVFHPAVNKWHGIVQLAALLGVDAGRVVAIGDDVNDLAMLENAMLGVAMGNARPDVKSIADRVIRSNADDGLAELLMTIASR
jgi:hydroxymethylpyrimidine pyrophosphatase-like HAD family hydrolase